MKTNYFFYTLVCILFLAACKTGGDSASQKSCPLAGKFINYTVLENCPDVLPGEVPSYVIGMHFKSKDTVDLTNGFEQFRLRYTGPTDSCIYTIIGATQFGDMHFTLQGDTTIRLFDSAWTQLNKASVFRRIDEKLPWDFDNYLNECVLVGTFDLVKEGVPPNHKVVFLRNGQVDGMSPYLSYEICYAGDCLGETDPPSNTIDFLDDRNNKTTFVMKIASGRRLIQFYSIADPVPDVKGERKIGAIAFELKQ